MCNQPTVQRSVTLPDVKLPAQHARPRRIRRTASKDSVDSQSESAAGGSVPVTLHLYDLGDSEVVSHLNDIFQVVGAFHAGVEIHGREWSFGFSDGGGTGVFDCEPMRCDMHTYRESIVLGWSPVSEKEASALIAKLSSEWVGSEYDLIRRNCCHFAECFAQKLGVSRVPEHVVRLAGAGAAVDDGVRALQREISTRTLEVLGGALLKARELSGRLDGGLEDGSSPGSRSAANAVDVILDPDDVAPNTSHHVFGGAEALMDYAVGKVTSLVSCVADPDASPCTDGEGDGRARTWPLDAKPEAKAERQGGWMAPMFL